MKKFSIGLLVFAGICGVVYLPLVFAADTPGNQKSKGNIEISCKVTITDAAGMSEIVAEPRVVAVDGKTTTVAIGQANGESIEIQLIGRLLDDANSEGTKTARSTGK